MEHMKKWRYRKFSSEFFVPSKLETALKHTVKALLYHMFSAHKV